MEMEERKEKKMNAGSMLTNKVSFEFDKQFLAKRPSTNGEALRNKFALREASRPR
jgi:hypothetical protein